MERRSISSASPYEAIGGYCRAVVVGEHVFVAGTAPIMPDDADPPADAYGQTHRCLEIIATALREAGGGLDDVVRTRAFITGPEHFDGFARAHGETFGTVRPVNTTVVVQLLDPRWVIEIDVDAVISGAETGRSRP